MKKMPKWKKKFLETIENKSAETLFDEIAWENPVQFFSYPRLEREFECKVEFFKNGIREGWIW